jgi:hypothetical protein
MVLGTLLALPAASLAQVVDIPLIMTHDFEARTFAVGAYTHQFEADLDGAAGNMSRDSVMLGLGHRFDLSENWNFLAQFNYAGSYYDFSSSAGRGGGGASYRWKDAHTVTVVGLFGWKASETWTWLFGGLFKLSQEGGATDDASTGGGIVGFNYKASDRLKLGVLIGLQSQIEDGVGIIPLPTVDWRFTEKWRFQLGLLGSLGHPGVGPELSFRPSDQWELGLGIAYQKRRFRLDNHTNNSNRRGGPGIANNDGVGEETEIPLYARLRYAPRKMMFFDFFGGVTLGGRVRVENSNGKRINESDYDAAGILGLRGQILF